MKKQFTILIFCFYALLMHAQIGLDDLNDAIHMGTSLSIGDNSGVNDVGNNDNTFIGINTATNNTTGRYNIAIGSSAFFTNTKGNYNVALGYHSLHLNETGNSNSALGFQALFNNATGHFNTAVGTAALHDNTTGSTNTAIGLSALQNNTSGASNTSVGGNALYDNSSGKDNTAIGAAAMYRNTQGSYNTANGSTALFYNTTGYYNTAQGYQALYSNTTGNSNTGLGFSANSIGQQWNNSTGLGYNADCTASNQVRIGNAAVVSIGGFRNWSNISDGRFKSDVREEVVGLAFINALRPVTYSLDLKAIDDWRATNYGERDSLLQQADYRSKQEIQTGFIAQEVEAVAKQLGYDFSGVDAPKNNKDFYGLRYAEFVVPLVKAVQELSAHNELLHQEIQLLKAQYKLLLLEIERIKYPEDQAY